jgi:hypothetical protein
MNNRLFTFGCSFTNYCWPTWADIVGSEFDQFENWGMNGGGNLFILNSLTECVKRRQINKDDTVIIMWSGITRDDRWINGNWQLEGSVYGRTDYTPDYIEQYVDPTGYLIRDLSIVSATVTLLKSIGCRWYFLSMVPFTYHDNNIDIEDCREYNFDQQIIDLYQSEFEMIRPSVYEVIFNKDWYSRPGHVDWSHWKQSYANLEGPSWPSWKDFIVQNFKGIKSNIWNEINGHFKLDKRLIRTDPHPTPAEHLEYLQKVLTEIQLSEDTVQWALEYDKKVMSKEQPYDMKEWSTVWPEKRF